MSINSLSILEILIFTGLLLVTGLYSLFRKQRDERSYFLSDSSVHWLMVGSSLFSVDFFLTAVFAILPSSLSPGFIVVSTLLSAALMLMFGWMINPAMRRTGLLTAAAYYSGKTGSLHGTVTTLVTLFVLIVFGMSSLFHSINLILKELFGIGIKPLGIMLTALAGIFTVVGGYATVIRLQLIAVCGILSSATFLLIRGINPLKIFLNSETVIHQSMLSWIGFIIVGCWMYGNNQMYIQHLFAAKSDADMKKGVSSAVVIKICIAALFIFGLTATVPENLMPVQRAETAAALAVFLISVFLSAVLGVMNSSAAMISASIFQKLSASKPGNASILTGRLTTTIIVLILMLIVFITESIDVGLIGFFRSFSIILVSPVAAVSLVSLIWKQKYSNGYSAASIGGILFGCILLLKNSLEFTAVHTLIISDYELASYCFCASLFILSVTALWQEGAVKILHSRHAHRNISPNSKSE